VAVAKDVVYVVASNGSVYSKSLQARTPESVWQKVVDGPIRWLDVADGYIYGVSVENKLLKCEVQSAMHQNQWNEADKGSARAIAIDTGKIYILGCQPSKSETRLYSQALDGLGSHSAWLRLSLGALEHRTSECFHFGRFVQVPSCAAGALGTGLQIVCISDTHGWHRELDLPTGDVLVHAGDCTDCGEEESLFDLAKMFEDLLRKKRFKAIIVIAGNHDKSLQRPSDGRRALQSSCMYLEVTCITTESSVLVTWNAIKSQEH